MHSSLISSLLTTLCIYPHLKLFEIRILIARGGPIGSMPSKECRKEQADEADRAVLGSLRKLGRAGIRCVDGGSGR